MAMIFLKEIRHFIVSQTNEGSRIKGSTHMITYEAYMQGLTLEEIARQRNLNLVTVQSHIVALWEKGYDIDISSFVTQQELDVLCISISKLNGIHTKG
jgi:ATP-dependent DNA helicase RecQ